jgi:Xaa-Pro aminopeptidase
LRAIINTAITQAGGISSHTIVSCGAQTCDPNETGSGPLFANKSILLKVSPRSQKTGYYGEITRTVVKGRASESLRRLYHTVAASQELACSHLTDGQRASDVHRTVAAFFEEQGYHTKRRGGRHQGFFHNTGYGLGLENREHPRISQTSPHKLRAGQTITIGPGLYYSEIGGVRLKDVIHITRHKPQNLTKFEKVLEI